MSLGEAEKIMNRPLCPPLQEKDYEFLFCVCPSLNAIDTIKVEVSSRMRVSDLKQKIQLPTRTPCDCQRLVLENGEVLENDWERIGSLVKSHPSLAAGATVILIRLPPDEKCLEKLDYGPKSPMNRTWPGGVAVMELNARYLLEADAN